MLPKDQELGRRILAALAYTQTTNEVITARVDIPYRTISRWGKEGLPDDWRQEISVNEFLRRLAAACGLPAAFFTADFQYLHTLPPVREPTRTRFERAGGDGWHETDH